MYGKSTYRLCSRNEVACSLCLHGMHTSAYSGFQGRPEFRTYLSNEGSAHCPGYVEIRTKLQRGRLSNQDTRARLVLSQTVPNVSRPERCHCMFRLYIVCVTGIHLNLFECISTYLWVHATLFCNIISKGCLISLFIHDSLSYVMSGKQDTIKSKP